MNCEAASLLEAAKCFRCVPAGLSGAAHIYLLCQWANNLTPAGCQHDTVDDWMVRVGLNGGAPPDQTTYDALCDFMTGLDADGLTPKMVSINCIVPDNLTAARTPLIIGVGGNDPWTNVNFVAGDLDINGLQGNGAKWLNTGVIPSAQPLIPDATQYGMTVYNMTALDDTTAEMGAITGGVFTNSTQLIVGAAGGGAAIWDCWGSGLGRLTAAGNTLFRGFVSGNRISAVDSRVYRGSSTVPFAQLNGTLVTANGVRATIAVYVFARNLDPGGSIPSNRKLSFAAIHQGLTQAECQKFFNRVQAMREGLGGGFV